MRFIFALVANLTYTLFCASIQYVVVYLYSMIFFSSSLLLSEPLVLCMIFVTLFLYVLCLFLLVIFDLEHLQLSAAHTRSPNADMPLMSKHKHISPVVEHPWLNKSISNNSCYHKGPWAVE